MDVGRIDGRTQFRLKDTQQSQLVVGILGGTYIRLVRSQLSNPNWTERTWNALWNFTCRLARLPFRTEVRTREAVFCRVGTAKIR